MKSQTATRQGTADLAKGLAVLLMIQVHLLEVFADPAVYKSQLGALSLFLGGPPVAPVFMVILGYFLGRTRRTFWGLVARGGVLLVIATLLNIGLNFHLLLKIHDGIIHLNPWEFILGADILFLAGLSILVLACLRPLCKRHAYAAFLAVTILVALSNAATDLLTINSGWRYLFAFFGGHYSWSYFPLFPWLAYPILGFAFSTLQTNHTINEWNRPIRWIGLIAALFVLVFSAKYAVAVAADLPSYYHHGPLFFVWTALFLCVWFVALTRLHEKIGETSPVRFLKWIGENVLTLYIIQWLIIGNIGTALYRTQTVSELLLWFVLIVAATCLIGLLFLKLSSKNRNHTVGNRPRVD